MRDVAGAWLVGALLVGTPPASAQTPEHAASLEPVFREYCVACHGPATQTAGIDLVTLLDQRPLVRHRETWERVIEVVGDGEMPPARAPQPTAREREDLHAALVRSVREFDYRAIDDPGFEPMRRLTHEEYDNTVRDLFGVDLNPTGRFPDELTGASGFANSSNTLFLQSSLMERYIAVAERTVERALPPIHEVSTDAHRRARELVFVSTPGPDRSETGAAEDVLRRFLRRAYRRPPTPTEIERAVAQYGEGRTSGLEHEAALKQVLQAVLISPMFLFKVEAGADDAAPSAVTDYELATRLSYFLWASMPDDELSELATRGRLREPEVLAAQVTRMLESSKARTLGDVFAAEWLGFQHVGTRIWLDPIDNPWCTASLMTAMRDETSMFFMSLLRENQPVARLIDADYTYANEELATTLYGLEDVRGPEMRRVALDDPNRGGVLGHASILALTSNYKDTSPVKRGSYVLDTLLGTPPPPPPQNAGVLSDEVADMRDMSFREKLEMHSRNETCRACHSKIDPIGFSLENFDYFGRWRDTYDFRLRSDPDEADEIVEIDTETDPEPVLRYYKNTSRPIVASGSLPDGPRFDGPRGLKRALLETRHDDLVRQVVSKMLAYALGRQLEYFDEPAVRQIIGRLEADDYRFQTLLQAVVASYPFQYKKNPEETTR